MNLIYGAFIYLDNRVENEWIQLHIQKWCIGSDSGWTDGVWLSVCCLKKNTSWKDKKMSNYWYNKLPRAITTYIFVFKRIGQHYMPLRYGNLGTN